MKYLLTKPRDWETSRVKDGRLWSRTRLEYNLRRTESVSRPEPGNVRSKRTLKNEKRRVVGIQIRKQQEVTTSVKGSVQCQEGYLLRATGDALKFLDKSIKAHSPNKFKKDTERNKELTNHLSSLRTLGTQESKPKKLL